MATSSPYVPGSNTAVQVSTSDLDYQRKMIVLITSVIGCVVMVIVFACLFWGLWRNRRVTQKIRERQANPRYWLEDLWRKGNGKCTTEALVAMEEGKSAEMPKETKMKKDDRSDDSEDRLVEMKKVAEESLMMLMEESGSREEARSLLKNMEKTRI